MAVDRFGPALVVHVSGLDDVDALLPPLLERLPETRAVYLKRHPAQASRLTEAERLALSTLLWGEPLERVTAVEQGVRYEIRPAEGLSVGLFLDMREVRGWLREQAAGLRVLNLFAYTCAFGVCAGLGGARRTLNLDLSRGFLDWGEQNFLQNGLPVERRDFLQGEAFDWLGRFARRGEQFDLVIVDPPSFSSSKDGAFAVERDYSRLIAAAARCVGPHGMLLAATNHAGISEARFSSAIQRGLAVAERRGRSVRRWHEPAVDFPLAPGARPYLKIEVLRLD